jgi:hypothetical protein
MSFKFPAHGFYELTVDNNLLVARLSGCWNQECAEIFSEEFKNIAQPLTHRAWGHLVYLDEFELGVPEIAPIVQNLVSWCIQNGLQKSAQVYCKSMTKKYYIDKMVVEKADHFERQIFIEAQSAIDWLKDYGFTLVSKNSTDIHTVLN